MTKRKLHSRSKKRKPCGSDTTKAEKVQLEAGIKRFECTELGIQSLKLRNW